MLNESPSLDRVFHALADPARRAVLDRLSYAPASVSDLAKPLPMSLSAVIQHLRVLEVSGLVRSEKKGRVRTCRIEPDALACVETWIARRRAQMEHRLDQLGVFLDRGADVPPDPTKPDSTKGDEP